MARSTKRARRPRVVKGMPSVELSRAEFERRFRERFYDPDFAAVEAELAAVIEVAWRNYIDYRKTPRTRPAGRGFAEPGFALADEWLAARKACTAAQRAHDRRKGPSRFLLINGSSRSDQTCPGEVSKSWRLLELARKELERQPRSEVDVLDLSHLASEYGRVIHPCKACFSTSPALCHWPCSCYPNHAMGQAPDWMNEIYPRWVAAHGVMIVTPVNWYQAPSGLKLLIDRLVCADGGNPDPTLTHGKDPGLAKAVELKGWSYPQHLAGRAFAVVVHGDVAGVENLRRILCDWLAYMGLVQAGPKAVLDRYIGYFEPYATSHAALDRDEAMQQEVRNAALTLADCVRDLRSGTWEPPGDELKPPRKK
jgi:multimeric flavodoxin WrbA